MKYQRHCSHHDASCYSFMCKGGCVYNDREPEKRDDDLKMGFGPDTEPDYEHEDDDDWNPFGVN